MMLMILMTFYNNNYNLKISYFEGVACYCRHPCDARVNAGVRPGSRVVAEIRKVFASRNRWFCITLFPRAGALFGLKIGVPIGELCASGTPKYPSRYVRSGAPNGKAVDKHARQQKKYITIRCPATYHNCAQIHGFL